MSSSPPTTLGQYQIIREIARSNDIVYEAYDPQMNRRVAVKELAMPAGMTDAQKADRISRFKREAQAAGTLNHPHIMTVYSFAEDAGRTFMAMEFLDGHTLRNDIDTQGFIPAERAVEIAIQVLDGLGHAHGKGVIHRDIKPDNIQILSNGQVKITDFGIARLTFQPNITMDGQVFGTPSYMSPEQVVGKEIDQRSDIFSVGVVLYEMLSGQKPFAGDSVVTITYAIMNKEPQRPTQMAEPLWRVVSRALDKTPSMRFGSALEMIEELKASLRPQVNQAPPQQAYGYGNQTQSIPAAPTPFNPYGAQPQMPQVPAPTYPYNPYQIPPPSQNPYQQYPTMPPPGPLPIYYPPPPRLPLFKPETVIFMKKALIALLIFGSLFAIILAGLNALARSFQAQEETRQDRAIANAIDGLDPKLAIEERIEQAEMLRQRLSPEARAATDEKTAALYEQLARKAANRGDVTHAENWFRKAVELDPSNPALQSNLGELYDRRARQEVDTTARLNLLQESGRAWQSAAAYEKSPEKKLQFGEAAAIAFFNVANELLLSDSGDYKARSEARRMLLLAEDQAPEGTEVAKRVRQLLAQVAP